MKRILFPLIFLTLLGTEAKAAPALTDGPAFERILLIETSSMPVAAGQATLIIGPLQRTNGVYTGGYQIKVFPYFYKNEDGRLAIVVTDAALAAVARGKTADITGTATTSGPAGRARPIAATATPVNPGSGKLKLWFMAGDRKMIFEPAYHFAERAIAGQTPNEPSGSASAKAAKHL